MSAIGGNYEASSTSVASQVFDVVMPGTLAVPAAGTNTQAFTLPASLVPLLNGNAPILVLATSNASPFVGQSSFQSAAALNGCSIHDVTVSAGVLTVTFANRTASSITIPATLRLLLVQALGN